MCITTTTTTLCYNKPITRPVRNSGRVGIMSKNTKKPLLTNLASLIADARPRPISNGINFNHLNMPNRAKLAVFTASAFFSLALLTASASAATV